MSAKVVTHPANPATTSDTLYGDLVASLVQRGVAVPYGRTWGSVKAAIDRLVKDDDWIGSIEIGVRSSGRGVVMAEAVDGLREVKEL